MAKQVSVPQIVFALRFLFPRISIFIYVNQPMKCLILDNLIIQVHELSGCGDFLSALELARCVEDSSALLHGLHAAYGDDMFRKVAALRFIVFHFFLSFFTSCQGEFSGAFKQYAAGHLPLRSILRRFPDLIQGTVDAAEESCSSHPVMKAEDSKFVQAVVQLVRVCFEDEMFLCIFGFVDCYFQSMPTVCRCRMCRQCGGKQ
jgi:hypothetical protein